jgi:hypothetical protein
MAWASLVLAVVTALGGLHCLVTASPDFAKPTQTPPFLTNLVPPPYQAQFIPNLSPTSYKTATVGFDVISEDLQSPPLEALLLLDFMGLGARYDQEPLKFQRIAAGHLDSPPRSNSIDFLLPSATTKGCHSVTLLVSHEFVKDFTREIIPKQSGDVAAVTWWYQVGGDSTSPMLDIAPCVIPTRDGGLDGGSDASEQ